MWTNCGLSITNSIDNLIQMLVLKLVNGSYHCQHKTLCQGLILSAMVSMTSPLAISHLCSRQYIALLMPREACCHHDLPGSWFDDLCGGSHPEKSNCRWGAFIVCPSLFIPLCRSTPFYITSIDINHLVFHGFLWRLEGFGKRPPSEIHLKKFNPAIHPGKHSHWCALLWLLS